MDKEEIVSKIKSSKKYSGITTEIISKEVSDFIKRVPGYDRFKDNFFS